MSVQTRAGTIGMNDRGEAYQAPVRLDTRDLI
jgi:hypothetical protein